MTKLKKGTVISLIVTLVLAAAIAVNSLLFSSLLAKDNLSSGGEVTAESLADIESLLPEESRPAEDNIYSYTSLVSTIPDGEFIWEDYDFPFPKPKADIFEKTSLYEEMFFFRGMTSGDAEQFESALKSDGWALYGGFYVKGNDSIYYNDQTSYPSEFGGGYVRFSYLEGYKGPQRGFTNGKVLESIQKIAGNDTDGEPITVEAVAEIYVYEAYEKMNVQFYRAFGNNRFLGVYAIPENGSAVLIADSFLNNVTSSVCVADIDGNGRYELITLFGWGSGIWRIQATAYAFENPIYFNSFTEVFYPKYSSTWFPNGDFDFLKLVKISDTEVKVFGVSYDREKEIFLTEDYGILSGELYPSSKLVVSDENFPFYTH